MTDSSVSPWKAVGETDIETKRSTSSKDYQRYMIEGFYFQKKIEHDSYRERTRRAKEINAKLRFLPKHGK